MRRWWIGLVSVVSFGLASGPAAALDVVLTNDDGFETENIQALYRALVDAGHNVILSAPYLGQSGTSGKIGFIVPIFPTSEPSEGGLLPAGSPGVGPTTIDAQQFYVDGSPADALLYGLDVAAPAIFGGPPDLVLSGPNEGNNLGLITAHSGTIGATVTALNRGVPAIGISADSNDETTAEAELIAAVAMRLVDRIVGDGAVSLPANTGLNVNIPNVDPGTNTADDFDFELTRIGTATNIGPRFYEHLGDSPIAVFLGIPPGFPFPGVSVEIPYTLAGYPADDSPTSEGNVLGGLTVTVSVIEGTYQAGVAKEGQVRGQLSGLLAP